MKTSLSGVGGGRRCQGEIWDTERYQDPAKLSCLSCLSLNWTLTRLNQGIVNRLACWLPANIHTNLYPHYSTIQQRWVKIMFKLKNLILTCLTRSECFKMSRLWSNLLSPPLDPHNDQLYHLAQHLYGLDLVSLQYSECWWHWKIKETEIYPK